jgi:regulatory protein YycI of two-component signal transduction system YycFG
LITNFDAIRSLFQEIYPTTQFTVTGDLEDVSSITLQDGSKLSFNQTDVDKRKVVLQAEYDVQEYTIYRQAEYPPIGDQLDALYHAGVFPANMAARIKETKDKYPK